jgi:hypothetical protein
MVYPDYCDESSINWMPAYNEWESARSTAWSAQHESNQLLVYKLASEWCWRITAVDGFTMSAIRIKTLGEAFRHIEAASHRILLAQKPTEETPDDGQ